MCRSLYLCQAVSRRILYSPLMRMSFAYAHTGVTVLEFKNNENGLTAPKCMCYSDMAHLFAAGLDMKHNNHGEI